MRDLHEKLMRESSWYNNWHSHRGHGLAHWFLFFFIALLITSAVTEGINKNYLSENLANTAAVIASKPTIPNKVSKPITGQYIIQFKDDVKDPKGLAQQLTKEYNGQLLFAYDKAIKGFAAKIPDVAINGLKKNPNVKVVEQDQTVQATEVLSPTWSWGQDRIDQSSLPLNNSYTYNFTGTGVNVYVMDSGIRTTHVEFGGRATSDFDANYQSSSCSQTTMHWHGTHVAGTVGGNTVGVAKGVKLHSIRVLDNCGNGTISTLIAGVDYINGNKILPAVVNVSISGGKSDTLNNAINNSVNLGIVYAVAAGNSASDACNYSPASATSAITVGATTRLDEQASYSDYGTCVDIYAPGTDIYSAKNDSDTALGLSSGTSMATPHVAGVAALYLQQNPTATVTQVTDVIKNGGSKNYLNYLGTGSVNLLLNSLLNGNSNPNGAPSIDKQAPTAPSNLRALAPVPGRVDLFWDPSTDNVAVEGYNIYRNNTYIGTQYASANATTYSDFGVLANTSYSYYVTAYDKAGNSSSSNSVAVTTPAFTSVVDITSYSVINILSTSASIKWQTSAPANGTLTITNRKEPVRTLTAPYGVNQNIQVTGLKPNTSYSYQINASDGNTSDTVNGTFKTRR